MGEGGWGKRAKDGKVEQCRLHVEKMGVSQNVNSSVHTILCRKSKGKQVGLDDRGECAEEECTSYLR